MAQAFENILYYKIKLVIKMLYLVCLTVSTVNLVKFRLQYFRNILKYSLTF